MDKGFKKVILESDSVVVINLIIKNNATMDRNYNFIMRGCWIEIGRYKLHMFTGKQTLQLIG